MFTNVLIQFFPFLRYAHKHAKNQWFLNQPYLIFYNFPVLHEATGDDLTAVLLPHCSDRAKSISYPPTAFPTKHEFWTMTQDTSYSTSKIHRAVTISVISQVE